MGKVTSTHIEICPTSQTPVCQQRQQNTMNPLFHTGPSAATQDLPTESLDGSNVRSVLERQQFSFSGLNLFQARMTSSALPQQMTAQHSLAPLQPSQQVVGHQTPNLRTPYSMSQSQGLTQQCTWDRWEALKRRSSPVGVAQATGFAGRQQARIVAT